MDLWLKLSLIAAAIFCAAVIANVVISTYRANRRPAEHDPEIAELAGVWREPEVTSDDAEAMLAKYRQRHPDISAMWNEGDEGEPLPAAMLAPPNIGGEDHPPYAGPNYVADEDVAEEMIGLPHFYAQPAEVLPLTPCVLDLAFDFERGHIAPDGAVWAAPDLRVQYGAVQIPWAEQAKAARFGWEFIGDGDEPGTCKVHRSYETWHRFSTEGQFEAARQEQYKRDDH